MQSNFPNEPYTNLENNAHAFPARKNNLYPKNEKQSLEELAKSITDRGNDMQITHSKDGIKVFEVSKKLVKVINN